LYEYKATVLKVVDGDTYDLLIQCGFNITIQHRVRLLNVDAFETKPIRGNTDEQVELGKKIKGIMESLLTGKDVLIHTVKDRGDKYGRYLVDMYFDDLYINNYVKESGMAN
jgi:endonuclease YncB( thermonuclease family)